MSYFASLQQQRSVEMPEQAPLWEYLVDSDSVVLPEHVSELRHMVIDILGTKAVSECVGYPIAKNHLSNIKLAISEVITNAIRPDVIPPRHLTGIRVWAEPYFVRVSVGDDVRSIASDDRREQTLILEPDPEGNAPELYDHAFSMSIFSALAEAGLGGSVVETYADLSFSSIDDADDPNPQDGIRKERKVIHLGFRLTQDMLDMAA